VGLPIPRVQFTGISKRYPGVQALDDVSFSVAPGSIHALVGENGAGKSTLIKILAGATRSDSGAIRLDGEQVRIDSARYAQSLGIAVVYQEFSLVPHLSAGENVFLGRWARGRLGFISRRALHARSTAIFQSLGVNTRAEDKLHGMSVAQQQMVEIARALSLQARVLVLDEPSAVLTPRELSSLFLLLKRLTAQGVSVVYISHRLDEIFHLADSVTVLRDGRHVSTRPIADVHRDRLIHDMVGRPIGEEFPGRSDVRGEVILRVAGLSADGRFRHVSFEVRAGEVFALTGLVGSGRSSVGKALFGAVPRTTGTVLVARVRGPFRSPGAAKRAGVAYLPEDRKRQGLLLSRPLYENVTLGHMQSASRGGFVSPRRDRAITREKTHELQIQAAHPGVMTATLSGGNQQKVLLARWLHKRYRVIILDEPTRGVDVGAKVEIYGLLNRIATAGAAVVLITSELPEATGMADRIGVMSDGLLAGILENARRDVPQEAIMRLAVGARGEYTA